MAYNQPIWSCQSGTIAQLPPFYSKISSELFVPSISVTHKLQAYPDNKGLASLQTGLLIVCCICLAMSLPFRTANNSGNILYWILVSHHPDDVIIISSSSSPDTHFNDKVIQPPA